MGKPLSGYADEAETRGSVEPTSDHLVLLDELRRTERHAIVSRLSSVFAHLIGTPLNVIAGRAALIRNDPGGVAAADNAERIEQQVERLAARIRTLIDYWTRQESDRRLSPVAAILRDALALSRPVAAARQIAIAVVTEPLPEAHLETMSTLVVLTNLFGLSTVVATSGSTIEVVAKAEERTVVFELSVPGFVAPSARIDRLDPPEHDANGSGEKLQVLSICHAVAERSGARLDLRAGDRSQILLRCPAR
jgi:signal transduction histidine kinase